MPSLMAAAQRDEWLRGVLDALGDLVLELSEQGHHTDLISVPAHLAGEEARLRELLCGRSIEALLPSPLSDRMWQAVKAVLQDGRTRTADYVLEIGGELRAHEARIVRRRADRLVVVLHDVHDQRLSQHKLRESEDRFRTMADHAPVMLWKAGLDAECDFFNLRWLEFTGRPMDAEFGVGWAGGVHPADFAHCMDTYMEAFVDRRAFRMEYRLRRADGSYRWLLDQGVPRVDEAGVFAGFIGSCIDITDIKEGEARMREMTLALRTRLQEREVLLRELHHRVKNNLQLISSMHSLQARAVNAEAKVQLREAQRRVLSIALVHDKLYGQDTQAEVNFLEYAREAVDMLTQMVDTTAITASVLGDEARMTMDQAVPCALLVSELVTNALKHAFPGARTGHVQIEMQVSNDRRLHLSVRDDGVGLPDDVDLSAPTSVGLELVHALASQLRASITCTRSPGTRFDMEFALEEGDPT